MKSDLCVVSKVCRLRCTLVEFLIDPSLSKNVIGCFWVVGDKRCKSVTVTAFMKSHRATQVATPR